MKRYNDSLKETEFLENELQALEDEEDQQAEEELQNLETTEEEDKDFETRVIKLHLWAKQLKEGQFSAGLMELIQYKVYTNIYIYIGDQNASNTPISVLPIGI